MSTTTRSTFGNVRELPNGKFQARVSIKKRPHSDIFKTEKAAWAWLEQLQGKTERRHLSPTDLAQSTFAEMAKRWIAKPDKHGQQNAYKTAVDYESVFRLHVNPFFEAVTMEQLDGNVDMIFDYQEWLQIHIEDTVAFRVNKSGQSPTYERTNEKAQNYASWIFEYARKKGAILVNPYDDDGVFLPKKNGRREPLEVEQHDIDRLEETFGGYFGIVAQFDAYTGLRAGEVWALRHSNFNQLKKEIRVTHSVQEQTGKGLVMGPTKNRQSRTVHLPDFLFERLKTWVEIHSGAPDDWLFPTPTGEQMRHSNFMANVFKPSLAQAGLPKHMRFHDLRHHCAHWYLNEGYELHDVSRLLGHSSTNVTDGVYGGYMDKRQKAMAEAADIAWRRNREQRATVVPLRSGMSEQNVEGE